MDTANILTGAAGSGKTAYVIQQLLAYEDLSQEVWVLLPTRLQAEAFRDRLLQAAKASGRPAFFNIRLFDFYELYDHILDFAGNPQRTLPTAATDRILRNEIRQLDLPHYHAIAHYAGFVQLVSNFIKELKQGVVELEDFIDLARRREDKDRDLARIYEAYQTFLYNNNLVDRDGAGWVALNEVGSQPDLFRHVALLVVDGYDQFTPLQARLLAALSRSVQDALITLTYESHREDAACRTFARTLRRLHATGNWRQVDFPRDATAQRHNPLDYLEAKLFDLDAAPISAQDAVTLIEAPDPRSEVKAVLREVKRWLLNGTPPDDIMLVMRDAATYAEPIRSTARSYGIPVLVRQEEGVLENPAVDVLLKLIKLHEQDFRRRDVIDVLWSPYLDVPYFDQGDIARLEQISVERLIVGRREGWLDGLANGLEPREDQEPDEAPSDLTTLHDNLAAFFDHITPPDSATAHDYVDWIEGLLGHDPAFVSQQDDNMEAAPDSFNIYASTRQNATEDIIVRDVYALQGFRSALQEVLAAYDLLTSSIIQWDDFRQDLELALKSRKVRHAGQGSRHGRVLVTTVFEARGLPHPHVVMLGLSEGIFPAQQTEDPLYSNHEREVLEAAHIDLQNPEEKLVDSGLFYEMCALTREHLTLSRPTVDESGNFWSASIFWTALEELLHDPIRIRIPLGAVPTPDEAANLGELAISLTSPRNTLDEHTAAYLVWLAHDPIWQGVQHGLRIEAARESANLPFDEYGGVLSDADLINTAAEALGANRIWSATQFNELANCGFRFFSKRLLKLERYEEPEEGLDVLQLGNVNHAILEETYRRLEQDKISIEPDNLPVALDMLEEEAQKIFATAPRTYGFRVTQLWDQEKHSILEKLRKLVQVDFSQENPFQDLSVGRRVPFQQEANFGSDGEPPVKLQGSAGTLLARGFIDRMDLIDDQRLVVLDYKSGRTPLKKDITEGRNFQMMLYLLAAEELLARWNLPYEVYGGLFWSIQNAKFDTLIHKDDITAAHARLHDMIMAGRRGDFASKPGKLEDGKCARYCEFSQLCRMGRNNLRKPVV